MIIPLFLDPFQGDDMRIRKQLIHQLVFGVFFVLMLVVTSMYLVYFPYFLIK